MGEDLLEDFKSSIKRMKILASDIDNYRSIAGEGGWILERFLKEYIIFHSELLPKKERDLVQALDLTKKDSRTLFGILESPKYGLKKMPYSKKTSVEYLRGSFRNQNVHDHPESGKFSIFNFNQYISACEDIVAFFATDFSDPRCEIVNMSTDIQIETFTIEQLIEQGYIIEDIPSLRIENMDIFREIHDKFELFEETLEMEWKLLDDKNKLTDKQLIRKNELENILSCFESVWESFEEIDCAMEIHYVPKNEIIEQRNIETNSKGVEQVVTMKPEEIDENAVWHWNGKEIPLLGNMMPIPDNVRLEGDPVTQMVHAFVDAKEVFDKISVNGCPGCGSDVNGIVLVTGWTKIFPAHCCNRMIWMTDERDPANIFEH